MREDAVKKKEARILILTSLFAFAWGHQRRIRVRFASHQSFIASPNNNKTSVKKEKYINKQGESLLKLNSKV